MVFLGASLTLIRCFCAAHWANPGSGGLHAPPPPGWVILMGSLQPRQQDGQHPEDLESSFPIHFCGNEAFQLLWQSRNPVAGQEPCGRAGVLEEPPVMSLSLRGAGAGIHNPFKVFLVFPPSTGNL